VDPGDNAVVTGSSYNQQGNRDYYTAKYAAANGAILWQQRYNGPANGHDDASAIAVDASGNVIVTGTSSNGTNSDYYTVKYAAQGGTPLWEQRYNGPGNLDDEAQAVAVDAEGNVVVTGTSDKVGAYSAVFYTAKYAGTNGTLLWERRARSEGNLFNVAGALAFDSAGNVVVAGTTYRFRPAFPPSYAPDYYTVKYAGADGALLWEQRYNGPANEDDVLGGARALAVGSDGSVFITGSSAAGRGSDYATIKYGVIPYPTPVVLSLSLVPPNALLRFTGDKGRTYRIQRALDPAGPWSTLGTVTFPSDLPTEYLDPLLPTATVFYRITAP
jgi:hypothetical protein